jgi:hypothetical protein
MLHSVRQKPGQILALLLRSMYYDTIITRCCHGHGCTDSKLRTPRGICMWDAIYKSQMASAASSPLLKGSFLAPSLVVLLTRCWSPLPRTMLPRPGYIAAPAAPPPSGSIPFPSPAPILPSPILPSPAPSVIASASPRCPLVPRLLRVTAEPTLSLHLRTTPCVALSVPKQ